jgi:hypothetical protein
MYVRVTIEAASKAEAQLIAGELPMAVEAQSWRGLGVIRLDSTSKEQTNSLIDAVSRSFHEHSLKWARVRYDDEERVFKANGKGKRPADQSTGSASGSASPAMR